MFSFMKSGIGLSCGLLCAGLLTGAVAPDAQRRTAQAKTAAPARANPAPANPEPVAPAPATLKPVNIAINVNRHLKSTDGTMLLYLRSGVWKPGGALLMRDRRYFTSFEGVQKGTKLTLNSFDGERGMDAPPDLTMQGEVHLLDNEVTLAIKDNRNGKISNMRFVPNIAVPDRPLIKIRLFGYHNAVSHRDRITRIEIRDYRSDKRLQTLTGFWAEPVAYIDYEDINYDGYMDLRILQDFDTDKYLYWLYNPTTRSFARAPDFEARSGYLTTRFWCNQIDFHMGSTYRMEKGKFRKEPWVCEPFDGLE